VTGDDRGTAVPIVVRHAAQPTAELIRRAAADAGWPADAGPQDRLALAPDRLGDALTETLAGQPAG
jgi:hypothetical protein